MAPFEYLVSYQQPRNRNVCRRVRRIDGKYPSGRVSVSEEIGGNISRRWRTCRDYLELRESAIFRTLCAPLQGVAVWHVTWPST